MQTHTRGTRGGACVFSGGQDFCAKHRGGTPLMVVWGGGCKAALNPISTRTSVPHHMHMHKHSLSPPSAGRAGTARLSHQGNIQVQDRQLCKARVVYFTLHPAAALPPLGRCSA